MIVGGVLRLNLDLVAVGPSMQRPLGATGAAVVEHPVLAPIQEREDAVAMFVALPRFFRYC
ncbi:hypothetical protein [Actinoplanes flavus]|uniref:Uncharacterized protein n=1 Tax=Actinoplanes flavus TaxID=2820290 RepID=A0ABS3UTT7_9ACTN|nr:hypothetical protein [Actinoplanes flavus]MBO3741967.1 hypothetical protein [Actinoplanes flavus]